MMQKKPTFVPDSEAFNSYMVDGFLIPELKDGSEASKDEQADSSSENNVVGNGALFVIGRHRSGGAIAHFLQDWEVAKVALSCKEYTSYYRKLATETITNTTKRTTRALRTSMRQTTSTTSTMT